MKRPLIPLAAAAFWAAFSFPAASQQVCTPRDDMVKLLSGKYKEQPIGDFRAGPHIVEVYVSEEGTVTLLSTAPNGVSCIFAAGNEWKAREVKKGTGL
jgi:hypothetical protein